MIKSHVGSTDAIATVEHFDFVYKVIKYVGCDVRLSDFVE